MTPNILVLCPFSLDPGLLSRAVSFGPTQVIVPESMAAEAAKYGAAQIYTLADGTRIPDEAMFALYLAKQLHTLQPDIVLAPATTQMRNIMSGLAWHLGAGLTADCTELSMENGRLLQSRPAFGNGIMADIVTESPMTLATVRPGIFPATARNGSPQIAALPLPPVSNRVLETTYQPFTDGPPLTRAKLIVAGGSGIGSREGFAKLEQLAKQLGGSVAASRGAVDAGFAPYRCQVGMTGVSVCPHIYIAVGISGAVQHLAGMNGSEIVIAINSDPKAPIFNYADFGFVGDWQEVLPKIMEELL